MLKGLGDGKLWEETAARVMARVLVHACLY